MIKIRETTNTNNWVKAIESENIEELEAYSNVIPRYTVMNGFFYAVQLGRLNASKWFYNRQQSQSQSQSYTTLSYIGSIAAKHGHLHILEWLLSIGYPRTYFWSTCAAENGHLHILKWFRSNGWDLDTGIYGVALRNGHLHIVKWCKDQQIVWVGGAITSLPCRQSYTKLKIALEYCDETEWIKAIDKELASSLNCFVLEQLIKNYI